MNVTELANKKKAFLGLTPDDVNDLIVRLNGVEKTFDKGEIIAHAGMEVSRMLVVVSGRLHAYAEPPGEQPMLVREIAADDVLGLWLMLTQEIACWPVTIVAVEDTNLISLDMEQARKLIANPQPYVTRLLANTAKMLASELLSVWRKMMVMSEQTIEARVMAYLTELDSETGRTGDVVAPFDRNHMAEYFHVTRPSLSRAICHLRDRGLITWHRNMFHLTHRPAPPQ